MSGFPVDRPYIVQVLIDGKNSVKVSFRTKKDAESYRDLIYPRDGEKNYIAGGCVSAYIFVHEAAFLAGTY